MNGHTVTQEDHDNGLHIDAPVGSVISAEVNQVQVPMEGQALPEEVDLDKLRDDRCIPVAKDLLKILATDLISDKEGAINMHPITGRFLQKYLDADLNIAQEVSYVPQLILGVLSGLNRTMQSVDVVPLDTHRYDRITRDILAMVAEADVRMNNVTPEEVDADFAPVKEKINALLAVEKLNMMEIKHIMDNVFSAFGTVETYVNVALEKSSQNAEAKLFGVADMTDLTMGRLNSVLTAREETPEEEKARVTGEEEK